LSASQKEHFEIVASGQIVYLCTYYGGRIGALGGKRASPENKKAAQDLKNVIDAKMHLLKEEKPYEQFEPIYKRLVTFTIGGSIMKFTEVELAGLGSMHVTEAKKKHKNQ
ncbi:MAG: hypothetical protein ACKVTZ_18850, partial [Bacteroidia bacterium]